MADTTVVMILRVWAMYNRSKIVIITLLTMFWVVMFATFLCIAVNSVPENLVVSRH